jgi:hypothetical protein
VHGRLHAIRPHFLAPELSYDLHGHRRAPAVPLYPPDDQAFDIHRDNRVAILDPRLDDPRTATATCSRSS